MDKYLLTTTTVVAAESCAEIALNALPFFNVSANPGSQIERALRSEHVPDVLRCVSAKLLGLCAGLRAIALWKWASCDSM